MRQLSLIISLLFWTPIQAQDQTIYLHNNWGLSLGESQLDAEVPGNLIMDLYRNGYITHPFTTGVEQALNSPSFDIEKCTYFTTLIVQENLDFEYYELEFQGLDTYAKVYWNDSLLGETNNMFRSWKFDISDMMKVGVNRIKVVFESPLKHHEQTLQNADYKLPSGNESGPQQVSCYSRKAAYQFGWDWAPRMVGMGIWRPVKINLYKKDVRLIDCNVTTKSVENNKAEIQYGLLYDCNVSGKAKLYIDGKKYATIKLFPAKTYQRVNRTIKNPKLWNPVGYGDPNLYTSDIHLVLGKDTLLNETVSFGIRKAELVQEEDEIGTSFYFKINDQKVFAKGANYVPMSPFPSQVDSTKYEDLIKKIVDANMNMIRVWGGGVYECDYFYDLCDQNGIMVWQDFMFANSMYPQDLQFKINTTFEADDQVYRLNNHPSVVLWCGNNEIDVAWKNWGWQDQFGWTEEDSAAIWKDYNRIFKAILPGPVELFDQDANYVHTSPLSNWGTPENFNHSSMHYWGVWHGQDDFDDYKHNVGRFMVEYGFQSYPTLECMRPYLPVVEVSMEDVLSRQKSYVGNKLIIEQINKRYGDVNDLEDWLLLSQHIQALAMKKAIQAHRLSAPHCMGTLFWQLNDCWPGPSWSVIDYDLNEKVAYEVVKKQFSPLLVVADTLGSALHFSLTSDLTESTPVKLKVKINSENESKTVFSTIYSLVVPTLTHVQTNPIDLDEIFKEYSRKDVSAEYYAIHGLTSDTLFYDNFYFGLSPAEKEILNN